MFLTRRWDTLNPDQVDFVPELKLEPKKVEDEDGTCKKMCIANIYSGGFIAFFAWISPSSSTLHIDVVCSRMFVPAA